MSKIQDLTGQKFGRLTVLKFDEIKNKHYFWICKCDCGKICSVESSQLKSGKTKSCGCYKIDIIKKHYKTNTRLYTIWRGIKKRCLNKNLKEFYRYGGRGISVCKEWEKGLNEKLSIEKYRYLEALDEIEEVINNILNSCLGRNTVSCRPAHNVCGDLIKILDIINRAKDTTNET